MCSSCNLTIILLSMWHPPTFIQSADSETALIERNVYDAFVWIEFGCALKESRYDSTGGFNWHKFMYGDSAN